MGGVCSSTAKVVQIDAETFTTVVTTETTDNTDITPSTENTTTDLTTTVPLAVENDVESRTSVVPYAEGANAELRDINASHSPLPTNTAAPSPDEEVRLFIRSIVPGTETIRPIPTSHAQRRTPEQLLEVLAMQNTLASLPGAVPTDEVPEELLGVLGLATRQQGAAYHHGPRGPIPTFTVNSREGWRSNLQRPPSRRPASPAQSNSGEFIFHK